MLHAITAPVTVHFSRRVNINMPKYENIVVLYQYRSFILTGVFLRIGFHYKIHQIDLILKNFTKKYQFDSEIKKSREREREKKYFVSFEYKSFEIFAPTNQSES